MANGNGTKNTTTAAAVASVSITLPDGDVLVKKVRPPNGTHPLLGHTVIGRIYCVTAEEAVALCDGGEFEAVSEFKAAVDAKRNESKPKA